MDPHITIVTLHSPGDARAVFLLFKWVIWPVKTISLILSRVICKVRKKREIPEKNHLTTHKQDLAFPTYDLS